MMSPELAGEDDSGVSQRTWHDFLWKDIVDQTLTNDNIYKTPRKNKTKIKLWYGLKKYKIK